MLKQRKKDYFQRIIEEFFAKLFQFLSRGDEVSQSEKREILNEGFKFFQSYFEVERRDDVVQILDKIEDVQLIQYYAKLLKIEYETIDIKYENNLLKALSLIEYLQRDDTAYSWERIILREDILRLLEGADV